MAQLETGTADRGSSAPGSRAQTEKRAVTLVGASVRRATHGTLFCDVRIHRATTALSLSGELAAHSVAELGAELVALIRTKHHQLIIDLNGLSYISPVCVGVLNRAAADLLRLGGQLTLTGASAADAEALRRAGLSHTIRLTAAPP